MAHGADLRAAAAAAAGRRIHNFFLACLVLISFTLVNGQGFGRWARPDLVCPHPMAQTLDNGKELPWEAWMNYYHVEFKEPLPDVFFHQGASKLPMGKHEIRCRVSHPIALPMGYCLCNFAVS
jgi:hypothetical protein